MALGFLFGVGCTKVIIGGFEKIGFDCSSAGGLSRWVCHLHARLEWFLLSADWFDGSESVALKSYSCG